MIDLVTCRSYIRGVLAAIVCCFIHFTPCSAQQDFAKPFALVELYTSQGCASCPAAENTCMPVFSDSSFNRGQVIFLSFHVDYWNNNGWLDPFSKASYAERQRRYKAFLKSDGVYTPQLIINGKSGFSGANSPRLLRELHAASAAIFPEILNVSQIRRDGDKLFFHYSCNDASSLILNAALVTTSDTTHVNAGDNAGQTMISRNTVRSFVNLEAKNNGGTAFLQIPSTCDLQRMKLIVWIQDIQTAFVKDAKEILIP